VDDLANEQYKVQQELKRDKWRKKQLAADGSPDDGDQDGKMPDRLASLLVANQITQYCAQTHAFAGASLAKLFLTNGLQKA
jgi:hypothetical protein